MPISEEQLERWSHQDDTKMAIRAHESIRHAILSQQFSFRPPQIFLQGSYANDTNTFRDHDVDVVVQAHPDDLFRFSYTDLSPNDQSWLLQTTGSASMTLEEFRQEMISRLNRHFGSQNVTPGNKAIKIKGTPGYKLDADVVVCQQYRRYLTFNGHMNQGYIEGIYFLDSAGNPIINYPKQHRDNGARKHQNTNRWFKHTVRTFKNARGKAVDENLLEKEYAPSYYIQCLLYNVPDEVFGGSHLQNFTNVISLLIEHYDDWPSFCCQNGIDLLFAADDSQWSKLHALEFISALMKLSNK